MPICETNANRTQGRNVCHYSAGRERGAPVSAMDISCRPKSWVMDSRPSNAVDGMELTKGRSLFNKLMETMHIKTVD